MGQSYILFARDSLANGTRDKWLAEGGTAGTTPGRVGGRDGVPVAVPAYDAFEALGAPAQAAGGAANGLRLLASLDWASEGQAGFASSFLAAALADGRALAAPAGPRNPEILGDAVGNDHFDFGQFTFALADADWNRIKNLELFLDDEDLAGVSRIDVRNFVDVRVKLGDASAPPVEDVTREGPASGFERFVSLSIANAKRGSVDATDSAFNIDLTLSTTSNGRGWQNSFDIALSAHDDLFVLMAGDHAGTTADRLRLSNDGSFSLVNAQLGEGNDTYIGFSGRQTVRIEAGGDTGTFAVVTTASPLPGVIPDFTRIDRTPGDLLVAGAGRETFVYRAGDGADEILDFTLGQDLIAIDRSLRADAEFLHIGADTLIVFADAPPAGPGSTAYDAGIFVEGVTLGAADILWIA